ncbi:hypothetical protein K449DRAFT_395718 [Hypoxylon sp. EC38]|nr:hypothetical protein K449DRAFT_395718 [Hypoxylon sp. EC38]
MFYGHSRKKQGSHNHVVGSSSVHDQSSRTHAVHKTKIVNRKLVEARDALVNSESELMLVNKRETDISIEEQTKVVVRDIEGTWVPDPDYQINRKRIDEADALSACVRRWYSSISFYEIGAKTPMTKQTSQERH